MINGHCHYVVTSSYKTNQIFLARVCCIELVGRSHSEFRFVQFKNTIKLLSNFNSLTNG